jgi:hypothetical protein
MIRPWMNVGICSPAAPVRSTSIGPARAISARMAVERFAGMTPAHHAAWRVNQISDIRTMHSGIERRTQA